MIRIIIVRGLISFFHRKTNTFRHLSTWHYFLFDTSISFARRRHVLSPPWNYYKVVSKDLCWMSSTHFADEKVSVFNSIFLLLLFRCFCSATNLKRIFSFNLLIRLLCCELVNDCETESDDVGYLLEIGKFSSWKYHVLRARDPPT